MIPYNAPIRDMTFALESLGALEQVADLPGHEDITPDLVEQVLTEAGKLAGEAIAPLNYDGDKTGSTLENGVVRTPDGFRDAYRAYVDGGWNSIPFSPDYGGQGLPWTVATAVQEMWQSANLSWALCPLLTIGAVECLMAHGTEGQKATYLDKLVSGEWAGTMNLTEPQAGSDLALVKAKAVPDGDRYRISGQKIYITYGEHDWTDNIVHLVLARLPDAPEGVKGISLFLVPKFLVNADGSLGQRNDLRCVSLEHKLGINASPTCVMAYGDDDGAIGELIGDPHQGLRCMFTMMNNARLNVGLQGLAIAERAYQQARDYAMERKQGQGNGAGTVTIIHHPDVRRMLMTMKATIEAMRGLAYETALALDLAKGADGAEQRAEWQARVDLLTPIVKAWCTDSGVEMTSLGIQVHGGMGYIEETGAAQHWRDSRITPIYEGTNGIQAADLVGRKVLRDKGRAANVYFAELDALIAELAKSSDEHLAAIRIQLAAGSEALQNATAWLIDNADEAGRPLSGASPYLKMFGTVAGGAVMARQALTAMQGVATNGDDPAFGEAKIVTARFFAENVLPATVGLLAAVTSGHSTIAALDESQF